MTWEEACRILGVAPDATEQQIKDAYHALAQLLHPDVNQQKSEKVLKKAEDEFKKVNQAYDILKDPKNLQNLQVQPDHIRFSNVAARQIQTASFEVRYQGDEPVKYLDIDRPTWVTNVRYDSINRPALWPIRVEIDAEGEDWDRSYEGYITVHIELEEAKVKEAKVKVKLQTRPASFIEKVKAVLRTWWSWFKRFLAQRKKKAMLPPWRVWLKEFLAKHKKKVAWAITIPLTILILRWVMPMECPWPYGSTTSSETGVVQSAILGKWQHGFSECPPNMGSSTYELIKGLPESKPYSLEFSKNGQLLYISEGGTHSGKYSFVGQNSVQITWSSSSSPPDLGLQDGIYEVRFSGNKMGLIQQGKKEVTFTRIE